MSYQDLVVVFCGCFLVLLCYRGAQDVSCWRPHTPAAHLQRSETVFVRTVFLPRDPTLPFSGLPPPSACHPASSTSCSHCHSPLSYLCLKSDDASSSSLSISTTTWLLTASLLRINKYLSNSLIYNRTRDELSKTACLSPELGFFSPNIACKIVTF